MVETRHLHTKVAGISERYNLKKYLFNIMGEDEHKRGKSLNDYLSSMNAYTSTASTVNRSLAIGGIAIVWMFKKPDTHTIEKGILNIPLLLLAGSLALDLLQYFFGAIAWKLFYERKYWIWKNKKNFDHAYVSDIPAPNLISVPIYIIWFAKILAMIVAYYYLLSFLLTKI